MRFLEKGRKSYFCRISAIVVASLMVIFLTAGCKQQTEKQKKKPHTTIKEEKRSAKKAEGGLPKVDFAAFQLYHSAPIVAADQSKSINPKVDCFADAGLDPRIIKRSKGPEIVDALVSESAEFATLAITPVVLQAMQGNKFVIFATIMTTDHDVKVVGHKSLGIDSGASLKGKRVGYVGGTLGEIFLFRYLKKYNIETSDVSLTSTGPAQLRDLYLNNSLDAIVLWEPYVRDILADPGVDKNDVFIDTDTEIYTTRMNLVASPQILENKREEAISIVKAMICGEKLIKENTDASRLCLEKWLDRKPGSLKTVYQEESFRIELDVPSLLENLKAEAEWAYVFVFSGKRAIPDDFTTLVDTSIMEEIAPERVIK